ncbi:MAG: MFS transporter, partial [Anaerolineales bacterium]|nr:MFS transporter [Anaerolineales bacterium]
MSLIGDSTLYTVLPEAQIAAQLGLEVASVGLVLGVNRLVRLVFNPLAGSLYERFSRRWLLVISMLIGTAATASYGIANGLPGVLVGRVLWGAAWAGIWVGAHAMILDVAEEENRGRLNGTYQVWFFLGLAATALAGGTLTDLIGLRNTLWLGTGITGAAALFWLWSLP